MKNLLKIAIVLALAAQWGWAGQKLDLWFVYRDGCPACRQMKARLVNPSVAKVLHRAYVVHMVNSREQDRLPRGLPRAHLFPTLYFVDAKGKQVVPPIHNITTLDFWKTLKRAEVLRNKR